MRILVLNDSDKEFNLIKNLHAESEVFHANRYLQFLHQIEDQAWDIIYLKDSFSSISEPDSWVDSNGFKRFFNGVHAARAIATMSDIGKCPTKRVVISQTSDEASTMKQILAKASVNVSNST